jgi:NCAIR mutase (PurE)-related protein
MDPKTLNSILTEVQDGTCSIDQALDKLRSFPAESVTDACVDHQRQVRTGIPEVIYGASKTAEQITTIAKTMLSHGGPVLATRVGQEKAVVVQRQLPQLRYYNDARILVGNSAPIDLKKFKGRTLVICAGTSDIPVAEEARLTLVTFGHPVEKLYDAGVAGLHRLLSRQDLLYNATVIIVVAGMEGALPSVVGGLVSCPVIAVPTSVGYGASFGGIAALLGMLNSCAPGVAVVNIDNGFGAACMAEAINRVQKPAPG